MHNGKLRIKLIGIIAIVAFLTSTSTIRAADWCGWNNFLSICTNYASDGYCAVAMPFCDPVEVEVDD
jgi:hypothetical protein